MSTGPLVEAELTADGDMSGELEVQDGDFNIAIWGTFDCTVILQVKPFWRDVGSDWIAAQEYNEPTLDTSWTMKGKILVRAVCDNYVSGTAEVMLFRGEDSANRVLVTKKYAP